MLWSLLATLLGSGSASPTMMSRWWWIGTNHTNTKTPPHHHNKNTTLLSSDCCGQGLVVSHCHHIAVVRGWWSAIVIRLLWSEAGGQPLSSHCCGQGLVVSHCHHIAVVRGWWSAIVIRLLWSEVGGQPLSSHCCGQGLVVSYCDHVAVVRGWWSIAHTFFRRTLSRSFRENSPQLWNFQPTHHESHTKASLMTVRKFQDQTPHTKKTSLSIQLTLLHFEPYARLRSFQTFERIGLHLYKTSWPWLEEYQLLLSPHDHIKVSILVFLWWCFCGGVVVFLWWCFCGGVVVFLWWCGGVFVVVWWCFCGGVVVFLWWCGGGHITAVEQQKACAQQRNGLGMALVGRRAHILYANSFFAIYFFFFWNFRPRLARELLVHCYSLHCSNISFIQLSSLLSGYPASSLVFDRILWLKSIPGQLEGRLRSRFAFFT